MILLSLDLATRAGFAHGRIGERPCWGAHDFGRGRSNGEVLDAYLAWLEAKLDAVQPTVVAFESPYMPTGPHNPFAAPANALTIRRLFAFAGLTEAVCHRRRLRCYEARPSEITRHFLGGPAPRGRAAKKAATIKMCRLMGFDVADDDEADAVALFNYAEAIFSPSMVNHRRASAGLELDLHPKKNAPRSSPRSVRGLSPATKGDSNGRTDTSETNTAGREFQFADR